MSKTKPRQTPDRDSKYMGLAWMHAGFSKDPSTQVGAQIVGPDNIPYGSGYNGPPRRMKDTEVIWDRPSKDESEILSKYDIMVHAEINAIDHSSAYDLTDSTLYTTALPCPDCMLAIIRTPIMRVVYFDYQSVGTSSLRNEAWRAKTFEKARLGRVRLEKFTGNINWLQDWVANLKRLSIFEM